MRAVLMWLVSRLAITAIGAAGTATVVAFAFSVLASAPWQAIGALWIAVALATAAIVVLIARLWSPSPPQLQWRVESGLNDILWDEARQEVRHRVDVIATPIAAGGYMMGRTEVRRDARLISRGTRQRFTAELPLTITLEFGPASPPVQKLESAIVRQRYRSMGTLTWRTAVVLVEFAYFWGANGTLPGLYVFDDDSQPRQHEINAILATRWQDLERWYRNSWGHGFRTPAPVEPEEVASPTSAR